MVGKKFPTAQLRVYLSPRSRYRLKIRGFHVPPVGFDEHGKRQIVALALGEGAEGQDGLAYLSG